MPRKRKKTKESPNNVQSVSKRPNTMAQNGGIIQLGNQGTPNMSNNNQFQASQSYSLPPQLPYQNYNNQYMAMNSASPVLSPGNVPTNPNVQGDMMSIIIQRLDSMDKKLTHLESIQSSVNSLTVKTDTMSKQINTIESKIQDIENSRAFDTSLLDSINKRQDELDKMIQSMKKGESMQKSTEDDLKAEIIDLKCRSMRDNLIFYNLGEEKDENCENRILSFIEEELKIEDAKSNIKLHRAHRLGKYSQHKTRPIVAKFAYYPDRERVRKSSKQLGGTTFGISEQFPREIMETRKKLIPVMKKARENGDEAFLKILRL